MRIVHRIGLRASAAQRRELEALGVKPPEGLAMPGGGEPLLTFDVDEGHPRWAELAELFRRWGVSDVPSTEFSKKEIADARWLQIAAWHHGYPQPEDDFGYLKATYDLRDHCEPCGVGKVQRAPFQMKGEPKWGRNGILQLVWVYDELFVKPEVWERVFRPHGIERRPVLNVKGIALQTVVQLVIAGEVGIVTEGLPFERCAKCGRIKVLPVTRGPFPPLAEEPSRPLVRTREHFGSGGQADRLILISQELARALAAHAVRGAELVPVQ